MLPESLNPNAPTHRLRRSYLATVSTASGPSSDAIDIDPALDMGSAVRPQPNDEALCTCRGDGLHRPSIVVVSALSLHTHALSLARIDAAG